jgi:tetratricopeptide (TPR) repeat protein
VPQGAFGSRPPVTAPKAAGPGAAFGSRPPAFQSRPPAFQSRLAGSSSFNAVEIGDDGLADAEAALEAMQCFRSAEAALQRNDLGSAQRLAQKALDGDPTQNDYATLLAWTKALGGGGTAIAEAISTMTRVLHDDPSNERALLYRGKLYARGNYFREAEADFNELLAGNPHHRDAQAELRAIKNKLGG